MKLRFTSHRCHALTFIELLAVVLCLAVLVAMLFPMLSTTGNRPPYRINCVSNLKQINLALRIWGGDNNNEYPMQVAVTNGGGKEWIEAGDVAACFQVVSNELSTTRILICPADADHTVATNFAAGFNNSHISYFMSMDATENNPGMILDGDDNLAINDITIKSGVLDLSTNAPVVWTKARHRHVGNIGFADGSVWEVNSLGLQQAMIQSNVATNRIAIP